VHICTIQGLVRRVLASAPEDRPPVDQYDLMIIDECHRGYLLDREMSDTEAAFRDEADYISKYRRVLEHFDATKIGLTATPALHTSEIFGQPVYRYGYREAVVDGWLIDHDPPHQITTALSAAGITFERGETVPVFNTETGEIDLAEMEDDLGFQVQHFNRKVLTPTFNKVVAEELASHIDPWLDGKTLIFAASDRHADHVVEALLKAYRAAGEEIEDDVIQKVTGSTDKVSNVIRSYKNDDWPSIAVTVDLLTTGIDVPKITNLVFLRRVNSRILYDQMIGRATRRCDEIGKEVFQIYDAVDLYPQLQNLTEMRPVVVKPSVTFEELFDGLEHVEEESHQEQIREQIAVKLARKVNKIGEKQQQQYEVETGETPAETLARFRSGTAAEVRNWAHEKPGIGAFFDFSGERGAPPILPISQHDDRVIAVTRGYGDGTKPEDFIESFTTFVRDNQNKIAALKTVLTRPRDLTRSALKELRTELDRLHFTEPNLRSAWQEQTNDDVAASIIGFIRQAAIGDPLIPYAERIDRAARAIATRRNLSSLQRRWLERIAEELKRQTLLDAEAFDQQPFEKDGGFRRFNKIFNGELEQLLIDIQDEAWKPAA
ncbi:MAG: type I restriction-modification system endonuclease, partial [Geminicoccaceae bacterium]